MYLGKLWIYMLIFTSFIYTDSANCNKGFFRLENMRECHPWLTCEDLIGLDVRDLIGYGAVKQVYKSTWQNITIAFVHVNNREYLRDFWHGFEMLKGLGPSQFLVQLIGFCMKNDAYMTEYHPYGNSINVNTILDGMFDLKKRFELCVDYVKILDFLHNSPIGTRVMCDSSTLNKTLEQYLISSSLNLILNDVDALPEVGPQGIICGHKELQGSFVAPEQRWPFTPQGYDQMRMTPYNEKVDVWKIPLVCNYYLGNSEAAKVFRYHVYPIHKQCKQKYPTNRPTAADVLKFYENLHHEYFEDEFTKMKEEL